MYRIRTEMNSSKIVLSVLVLALIVPVLTNTVLASFKVIVEVDNVNSFSGTHTIKVKTNLDGYKTIKKDLGKVADYQDESEIQFTFTFKHSPSTFKACLDSECIKGVNSPAKKPEYVTFTLQNKDYDKLD